MIRKRWRIKKREKRINIRLTKHAKLKMDERGILLEMVKKVVYTPLFTEKDKFDNTLVHLIRKIENRYLRVIGRWENKNNFVVISTFFDRRIKKGERI